MNDSYLAVRCTSQTGSRQITFRYHFNDVFGQGKILAHLRAREKVDLYQKCGWRTEVTLHDRGDKSEVMRNRRTPTQRRR